MLVIEILAGLSQKKLLRNQNHFSAPNAYTLSKLKDSPTYSLASRPKDPKKYVTPAPGAYEVRFYNEKVIHCG